MNATGSTSTATPARLLTVAEVAVYCGLSEKAVRHRVTRGAIPVKRLGLRTIRFDARALEAWMSESARFAARRRRGGDRCHT